MNEIPGMELNLAYAMDTTPMGQDDAWLSSVGNIIGVVSRSQNLLHARAHEDGNARALFCEVATQYPNKQAIFSWLRLKDFNSVWRT